MTPRMTDWDAIDSYDIQPLETLFERDGDRLSSMSLELGGIYFDWSKTHLDAGLLDRFIGIAEARGFAPARDSLNWPLGQRVAAHG